MTASMAKGSGESWRAPPSGVTVVIPTINRAEVLIDTVRDLLAQTFDRYEIIVVDQSDETNHAVVAMFRESTVPARYYKADNFRGLPQARNFGWRNARHDIILYIDDDIRTTPNFVSAHYDALYRTGAAMVAGGIDEARGDSPSELPPGSFNWWTCTPVRNFSVDKPGWCVHAPGGNFAVYRAVLSELGGLDEVLSIGAALYEESELALRLRGAGHRVWFEPAARLTHLAAPMGGCRVQRDVSRYMHGLAHNRGILIFRHLKPWHRATAIARLLMLGLSYSRVDKSLRPFKATFSGLAEGRKAAAQPPVNNELRATECTSC